MSWETICVGDVCKYTTSGGTPKTSMASYYEPPTIPWLKTKEVNYCRIYQTVSYISQEGLEKSSAKLIPENSVIVAMYGQGDTAGRVAINKIPISTNQACCNLVIDPQKADYEFVYYALSTLYEKLVSLKNGGAQPNLNAQIIRNVEIPFPPLETQHRIAKILSSYDYLIENNQKQIKLLEEAAQRLYKEWFVDMRFPGHETTPITDGIPEGWKRCLLSDVIGYEIGGGWGEEEPTEKCDIPAYVIRGTDLYGVTHGDSLGVPYRYHAEKNLNARKLSDGDIVFEVSGGSKTEGVARTVLIRSAMLEQWGEPVMCASFCKLIRVKNPNHAQLLYDAFQHMRVSGKTTEYDKRSASSIVNYRWKDFLATEAVLIPDDAILDKYNAIAGNMYQMIVQKSIAIEKAKDARDRLLPKLMNGEIVV